MTRLGFDRCCAQSSSKASNVLLSKRYVRCTVFGLSEADDDLDDLGRGIMLLFYEWHYWYAR